MTSSTKIVLQTPLKVNNFNDFRLSIGVFLIPKFKKKGECMQTIRTVDSLFYQELGKKLRRIREHRQMTLKEVSQHTGYSRPIIDHWELGLNKIKPKQLDKLCEVYQVSNNLAVNVKLGFLIDD